jgi:hypothetical protein
MVVLILMPHENIHLLKINRAPGEANGEDVLALKMNLGQQMSYLDVPEAVNFYFFCEVRFLSSQCQNFEF